MNNKKMLVSTFASVFVLGFLNSCQTPYRTGPGRRVLLEQRTQLPVLSSPQKPAPVLAEAGTTRIASNPRVDVSPAALPAVEDPTFVEDLPEIESQEIEVTKPENKVPELKKSRVAAKKTPKAAVAKTYRVKKGDTLSHIAVANKLNWYALAKYNNIDPKKSLRVGQEIKIPSATELKSTSSKKRVSISSSRTALTGGLYVVKNGDNPWTIAKRFGVRHRDLLSANNLGPSSMLRIGQKLVIPGKTPKGLAPPKKKKGSGNTSKQTIPSSGTHIVKSGENPWTIAKKYGVSHTELVKLNGFDSNPRLKIGQEIKLPGSNNSSPVTKTAEPDSIEPKTGNDFTPEIPKDELTPDGVAVADDVLTIPVQAPSKEGLKDWLYNNSLTWEDITKYNPTIKTQDDLKEGVTIQMPIK